MAGKIFINYRRGDDAGHTGRLFDHLQNSFASEQLFLDIDNIPPGLDFVQVISERVAECDILLAVIGKGWIDARDGNGVRRLDHPDDFVRVEIASALSQGKRVIPILVGDATMPSADQLPDPIRPLARRNAVRLTYERFRADTLRLIKALQRGLGEIEAERRAINPEADREAQETRRKGERARRDAEAAYHAEEDAPREHDATDDDVGAAPGRPRRIELRQGGRRVAVIVAASLALISIAAVGTYWLQIVPLPLRAPPSPTASNPASAAQSTLEARSTPGVQSAQITESAPAARSANAAPPPAPPPFGAPSSLSPDQAAWDLLRETSDEHALKRFMAQYPGSALYKDAQARIVALEAERAAVVWQQLKNSSDEASVRRFIVEYPESIFVADAQARLAALSMASSAQSLLPSPDQDAWTILRETTDAAALKRFVFQYPNSDLRKDAETRIAALEASAPKTMATGGGDPHEMARSLQLELKRVGCFGGAVNGEFDDATKAAWHSFQRLTSMSLSDVSSDAIKAVRGINKRICPLVCPRGEHAEGEVCVSNPPPPPKRAAREAAPGSGPASLCATYVFPKRHPECPGHF